MGAVLLPFDEVAALAHGIGRAEALGEPASPALDAALERLRARFRELGEEDRRDLARIVRPLRERRDTLPSGARAGALPVPIGEVLLQLGVEELRPGQDRAILAALGGHDALVVMATGSGKSLCYQAPALALGGLSVVVSPLIALIDDQHDRLRQRGLAVRKLTSSQGPDEAREALATIREGRVRLVFCSPERFSQRAFLDAVAENPVELFVVDEAHCLAEWGHDFRPEYLKLAARREAAGARATMALTATATPRVAREIAARLGLRDPVEVRAGFDRPNIAFDVVPLAGRGSLHAKGRHLLTGLSQPDALPAIVYCGTRRDTDEVRALLQAEGITAARYHAGMPDTERARAQEGFMSGQVSAIAATNAFGMGVDKADVRSVWHWSIPTSLEAYYQEAGRAGRDGEPARAVLLALALDLGRLIHFNTRNTITVEGLARTLGRLAAIADTTGGFLVEGGQLGEPERLRLAVLERVGALTLLPARGAGVAGELRARALSREQSAAAHAQIRRAADVRWAAYRAIKAYAEGTECRRQAILHHFGDRRRGSPLGRCCDVCDPLPPLIARPAVKPAPETLDEADEALFERLRAWRRERAEGKPAYTVCADRALRSVAAERPASRESLAAIAGIGPAFLERHGDDLLALLGERE